MCLAQGHNAVTPVRLKPASPRSRVKHSTTEPLRSLDTSSDNDSLNQALPVISFIKLSTLDYPGRGPHGTFRYHAEKEISQFRQ